MRAHLASAKRDGLPDEQIDTLKEPGGPSKPGLFSPEERAVLRFTDLLTSRPGNIHQTDLDGLADHFNRQQIVEIVVRIAMVNFTNRINEGLRTPVDF